MPPALPTPHDPIAQLLSYRTFFGSHLYLPDESLLDEIEGIVPYWFPLYDSATSLPGGSLGPQQTDRGQIIAQEDCWLLSLMASSSQAAGFAAQLYDSEREITFMDTDIAGVNFAGTALRQFYLKTPVRIPVGGQLESRIINLATVANIIQLVGHGVRPDYRKKIT
jgi:hypothetical protein